MSLGDRTKALEVRIREAMAGHGGVWGSGVAEVSTAGRSGRGAMILCAQIDAGVRLQPSIPAIGRPARIIRTDYKLILRADYEQQKTLPRMNGAGRLGEAEGNRYKGRFAISNPMRLRKVMDLNPSRRIFCSSKHRHTSRLAS